MFLAISTADYAACEVWTTSFPGANLCGFLKQLSLRQQFLYSLCRGSALLAVCFYLVEVSVSPLVKSGN